MKDLLVYIYTKNRLFRFILLILFSTVALQTSSQNLTIVSISPQPNSNNTALNDNISIAFDLTINNATLTSSSVRVTGSQTGAINGVLSGGGSTTITFDPTNNFKLGEIVSVTVNKTLLSQSGFSMARGHTYSFTAISGPPPAATVTLAQRHVAFDFIRPENTATIDFEGDGDLDFIVTGEVGLGTQSTHLYRNDGNQEFCKRDKPVGYNINVELYDIDGDGDLDSFSPGGNGVNLNWHRNEGDEGFFTNRSIIANNDIAWTVRGNDLDSDGDADLVAMMGNSNGTSNLKVYRNNGAGVFSAPLNLSAPSNGFESETYLHLADINTDGAMDILAYRDNSNNIVWYQNNGALIFTEKIIINKPENQTLSTADIDGDGDIDILSVGTSGVLELAWFENDGNENFTTHTVAVANTKGVRLDHIKAADVDGDLDMDLLSAAYWFENDGSENFTQHPINEGMNRGLQAASYGDMDNDGDMDLVSTYNWHENQRFMNVTTTSPANAGFSVAANTNIQITFDQLINPVTLNSKTIVVTSKWRGVIPGTYSGGGTNTITFNPTSDLLPGEDIEVAVTSRVRSLSGHALEINYGIDFKVKVSVAGTPTFSASQIKTYANAPTGMDIADMDGDGDIDAVSCSSTELLLHQNDGLGNFTTTAIPITVAPKTVHATDFNKDGKMDILVYASLTYIYLNDGSQNFTETLLSVGGGGPLNTHGLADVDRDGDTDIIYGSKWSDRTCTFFYAGSSATITGTGRSEKIADLDGDGDIDFMKATSSLSAIQLNDGYLNWTALNIDASTASTDLADFDGDGDFDIISSLNNSTLAWYDNKLNTASKNFGARKPFGTSLNHSWVTAADLDGDGDADVAAVSASAGRVVWHRNQLNEASNNFSAAQLLPNSGSPFIVKVADLNGDGTMDLVVLSNTNNALNWFANSSFPLPTITSFSPASGIVGTTVTINGTNFSTTPANNTVKLNGTTATVSVSTSTSITTTVPAGATTGKITVTVAGNTGTSATNFIVTGAPLPSITNFSPTSGAVGTAVTITGANFSTTPANNTVKFNGTTATVSASTSTSITTNVPSGATTGNITLTVAGNTATSATIFIVTAPLSPAISGFTPTIGPTGTSVIITGVNFDPIESNNNVTFNGVAAFVLSANTTTLIVEVPVGATTGLIGINVGPNTATSSIPFTVLNCTAPRASGDLDIGYDPIVQDVVAFTAIEVQSTGKSIVAAPAVTINSVGVQGLLRFNVDGSLDGSFNSQNIDPYGKQMLVQPDDKIVVINNSGTDTFLDRLNADGTKDISFTQLAFSNTVTYPSFFSTIARQPDGKILYVLYSSFNGLDELFRLNADGTPDATFIGPQGLGISVVKVQVDGKILIGSSNSPGIYRLTSTGSIDASFDPGSGADNSVTDLAIQPDGKIIITGYFSDINGTNKNGIARLLPNGLVDTAFNPGLGININSGEGIESIQLLSNNQVVIAGYFSRYDIGQRLNLAKINTDGSVDCSFDPVGSVDQSIIDLAIQPDGKILVAGDFTTYDGIGRNALARVNNTVGAPTISINPQPANAAVCVGVAASFSTLASGTTNIVYQWQFSPNGSPLVFADIANGANYSGGTTATLSVNTAANFGAGRYRCKISGDLAATVFSADAGLSINAIPTSPIGIGASSCISATTTLNASGGAAGQYRWYTLATGGTAITGQTNSSYTTPALSTTTTYYVSIDNGTCESARTSVIATINPIPTAPTTTGASGCSPSTIILNASGGTNGQYRWYTVATGGTAITGQTNSSYTTPSLTTTTTYFVSIDNGTCESARALVVATINPIPAAPTTTGTSGCSPSAIILNASGGTNGQYRWYTVATGGTAITGQTNSSYTTPSLTTTTTYFVSIDNGTCESTRTSVLATITGPCAQPPVINTAALSTTVGGTVTIDLKPLITTSGTLDINSIQLVVPPSSGAKAPISNGVLTISYQGIAFTGKEIFSIRACDNNGNCSTQQFEIEVAGDVVVYNALSPNGANPVFTIQYIDLIPETKNNTVSIFDRWQNEVWSASNYDNSSIVFKGVSNSGSDLPTGIYFYKIEFNSGQKMRTGFISLKR